MRNRVVVLLLGLLLLTGAGASEFAFVNVNVVAMTSPQVQMERTVIVRDGLIAEIGPVAATKVPKTATVIDGTDRYLMPGLIEMHAHVPGARSTNLDRYLTLFAVNGITTVRGMLGQASHLDLRTALLDGDVFGPRLYTSGPSLNGNSVSSPGQAASMVTAQQRAGYDFVKIHPGLSEEEFRAAAAAAQEAGIRLAGHVPADVGLPLALELGISTIDHLDGYMQQLIPPNDDPSGGFDVFFGLLLAPQADSGKIAGLARATRAAGTWNAPTQTLFEHRVNADNPEHMAKWPEMQYVRPETVANWVAAKQELLRDPVFDPAAAARAIKLRRQLIRALHEAGAELLLASDAPQVFNVPGFSAHRELTLMVASGVPAFAALQAGTINAARWLGAADRIGTVETGKEADLILLDDNPLTDIENTRRVHGVMLRGTWLDRHAIEARLRPFARGI